MFEAMYIAATGVTQQQRRIDTIADNISNVNTTGYKASRVDFKTALYEAGGYAYADETANQQKGHGVMLAAINSNFQNGNLTMTDNNLDFAIAGEGFFELESPNGEQLYSKAGNFYLSSQEDGAYLVNANGYYVLDQNSDRIQIPPGTTGLEFSAEGGITFLQAGQNNTEPDVQLAIRTFTNLNGLASRGSGTYAPTEASGDVQDADSYSLRQGALEASNVDLGLEMTRLIRAQRAFSLASRALTTADDMEGIANNLRR